MNHFEGRHPSMVSSHSLMGRRVLVTGAGGFIASHLIERLIGEGAVVRAFLRYNSRSDPGLLAHITASARAAIECIYGDLRDADAVMEAMRGEAVVFHLGALIAIPYSFVHPREVVEVNLLGTLNVLMAARALGTERVVHISTSEVYGTAQQVPMREDHPLQAQSPYAASKVGADKLVESFVKSFGLPATIIRPFNTYGPRQSARSVIPAIISQVLSRREASLGDVTPRRDFTYVTDTVDALVRASSGEGLIGETVHLGSGSAISILNLAHMIFNLLKCPIDIKADPVRFRPASSEVRHLEADASKAEHLLGWKPQVPLEEGLARTIAWMQQHAGQCESERYIL